MFKIKLVIGCLALAGLFLVNANEAKAQCQNGYTPRTVNMIIDGCLYEVQLCVHCSIGPVPSSVYVLGFILIPTYPPCTPTLTANQVLHEIESQVITYDFIFGQLCDPQYAPPCPTQSPEVEVLHSFCWYCEIIEYFGELTYFWRSCPDTYGCYEKYTWCWQPYPLPSGSYVKTMVSGPTSTGPVNCTLEGYQIYIPPIKPWTKNWKSDCYIYHTACNP